MKKFLPLMLMASVSFANVSMAADNTGFYIGAKGGVLSVDVDTGTAGVTFDDASAGGFYLGYQLPVQNGEFAVEFEMNVADVDVKYSNQKGQFDFTSKALYGAYRSEGSFFYKVKMGILNEEIESSGNPGLKAFSVSDTGLSLGIGGGVRFANNITLETEYTIIEQDVGYLSLSAHYNF